MIYVSLIKVQSKHRDVVASGEEGEGRNERVGFNCIISILVLLLKRTDLKQIWQNVNICLTWHEFMGLYDIFCMFEKFHT